MTKQLYAGLFFISLATLMYELLLTRIWSVTMWYHFAFVAISVTMFGMTVGAIGVYLFPDFFRGDRAKMQLAAGALLFSLAIVISFLTQLCIPFVPSRSLMGLYLALLIYSIVSLPFCISGVCTALALTRFPDYVGKLYAADLIGAALGCIVTVYALKLADGPTAVILAAAFACLGALFFARAAGSVRLKNAAALILAALIGFVAINTYLAEQQRPLIRLLWVKSQQENPPLYEKWNAFSRLTVVGDMDTPTEPFGWGMSPTYRSEHKLKQLWINLDGFAQTVMTGYSGNLQDLEHLKFDLSNIAYYLKPGADVMVVGAGAGRDVLSALAFDAKSVVAVDVNENIIETTNGRFGEFTGHLDTDPRVHFVKDEARSYLSGQKSKFDIIQLTVIDTGIASAIGALALTENSLYTVEAWTNFLEHLNKGGLVTCSRWFFGEKPGEIYRACAIARSALRAVGVDRPERHVVILKRPLAVPIPNTKALGTIIVSRDPFSAGDLATLSGLASKMGFEIVQSPASSSDKVLAAIVSGIGLADVSDSLPIRIDAPTDDNPFFFYMLRAGDTLGGITGAVGVTGYYLKTELLLTQLLIVIVVLTSLSIVAPLFLKGPAPFLPASCPLLLYFGAIGLGFMFIEISQMERLMIVLGHPTYGLSVVLFTLLLSSGIGSLATRNVANDRVGRVAGLSLLSLVVVLIIFGPVTSQLTRLIEGQSLPVRIAGAALALVPIGLLMGTAFPLGLRLASARFPKLTAWFWGVNGATSVCASVVALFLAVNIGISAAYWTGVVCYVIALIALVWAAKKSIRRSAGRAHLAEEAPASESPDRQDMSTI